MKKERTKTAKRNLMLMLVAVLLVISLIGGTMAWLTISDSLTNTFSVTVGKVEEPGTPGEDDGDSDGEVDPPYEQEEDTENSLKGHIYEPNFENNVELALGKEIKKDPYIGIGKGSEKSYIFAWWDDNTMYYADQDAAEAGTKSEGAFTITANTEVENNGKWVQVATYSGTDGKSALYVWSDTSGNPMAVEATSGSAWTGVLFKDGKITVKSDIYSLIESSEDVLNTVDVYCFIHQAVDSEDTSLYDTALAAAKAEWNPTN